MIEGTTGRTCAETRAGTCSTPDTATTITTRRVAMSWRVLPRGLRHRALSEQPLLLLSRRLVSAGRQRFRSGKAGYRALCAGAAAFLYDGLVRGQSRTTMPTTSTTAGERTAGSTRSPTRRRSPRPPHSVDDRATLHLPQNRSERGAAVQGPLRVPQLGRQPSGFDPTQPLGGVDESKAPAKRADYLRAQTACLEARGYSVK